MAKKKTTKNKVGPPKKPDTVKRPNFSVSFGQNTISDMDKQRGVVPRSRYIEEAVIVQLKKGKK